MNFLHLLDIEQWFFSREASINFQGDPCPYALDNMKSLINKFTNEYICFNNFFDIRGP